MPDLRLGKPQDTVVDVVAPDRAQVVQVPALGVQQFSGDGVVLKAQVAGGKRCVAAASNDEWEEF